VKKIIKVGGTYIMKKTRTKKAMAVRSDRARENQALPSRPNRMYWAVYDE
jgi:hypothetical protein